MSNEIIIHEIHYQNNNHPNFQQRMISISSWDKYIECIKGEHPYYYHVQQSMNIVEIDNERGYLRCVYKYKFSDELYIHEAHVYRGDIPIQIERIEI